VQILSNTVCAKCRLGRQASSTVLITKKKTNYDKKIQQDIATTRLKLITHTQINISLFINLRQRGY
jgi:hypothetical protein